MSRLLLRCLVVRHRRWRRPRIEVRLRRTHTAEIRTLRRRLLDGVSGAGIGVVRGAIGIEGAALWRLHRSAPVLDRPAEAAPRR